MVERAREARADEMLMTGGDGDDDFSRGRNTVVRQATEATLVLKVEA